MSAADSKVNQMHKHTCLTIATIYRCLKFICQERIEGKLELLNVDFRYPTRKQASIFTDLSISAQAGQTLALVGPSGSGKSTIVSLVERFYDPQNGQLMLDGTDIRVLNVHWLRSQISIVSQDPVLFNTSIANNIRYGASFRKVSDEEIITAAQTANAHEFIQLLPQVSQ